MKRCTFMANICAGDIRPYGIVCANSPEMRWPRDALAEAAELALCQRAKHDHAFGLAGGDRGRGVGDGARAAAAAAAPLHAGEAQVVDAERGGQPRRVAAIVAERREAIDVLRARCRRRRTPSRRPASASLNSGSGDCPRL